VLEGSVAGRWEVVGRWRRDGEEMEGRWMGDGWEVHFLKIITRLFANVDFFLYLCRRIR